MKRFLSLFAVIAVSLSLGGCLTLDSSGVSILKGGNSITAPIQNPAQPVNIYQVKMTYDAALDLANEYQDYCYKRPFKTLMADPIAGPVCKKRRAIVRMLDKASDQAAEAIDKANDFIARNPKVSAVTVIREAWTAVVNFQGTISTAAASAVAVQQ